MARRRLVNRGSTSARKQGNIENSASVNSILTNLSVNIFLNGGGE